MSFMIVKLESRSYPGCLAGLTSQSLCLTISPRAEQTLRTSLNLRYALHQYDFVPDTKDHVQTNLRKLDPKLVSLQLTALLVLRNSSIPQPAYKLRPKQAESTYSS